MLIPLLIPPKYRIYTVHSHAQLKVRPLPYT